MTFVQARRADHPDIAWNAHYNLTPVRPSPTWFSDDYPWLRAIYSDNYYGSICMDCAEFALSGIAIKKNNGAFVVFVEPSSRTTSSHNANDYPSSTTRSGSPGSDDDDP